ncbi:hypothetical protein JDV02_008952 [Purpureocillium takamizusanense]|uniref:Uncharacterized protein n=1 Tax=Purpureocillium takamizusanense TaxID=2060973 RepID=A0A9Q8QQV8_9HYPO|nr:uncharacterized protein JDV02_008952 [Purpureocillium takamizusanense]UNI23114.1 hypothetical protein JDV02_008952 [Purpureocillium takamizusanense]
MDHKFMSSRYANHKAPLEPPSPRSSLDVGDAAVEEAMEETVAFLAPPGDGKEGEDGYPKHLDGSKLFRCLLQVVASLLCLGVLFAGYDLYRASVAASVWSPVENAQVRPCGDSPLTARNRGCMFDPIAMAWLPDACHDFELTKEFLSVQQWHYWKRPDPTSNSISLANVMQGQHSTLFVTERYLRHRCVFAWRKLHRAVLNSTSVDGYATDWDGMMECEGLFKDRRVDDGALHEVSVGYPACRVALGIDNVDG